MRLARRSGSPLIITDPEGRDPFVLMPADAYEALLDGLEMGELEDEWEDDAWGIETMPALERQDQALFEAIDVEDEEDWSQEPLELADLSEEEVPGPGQPQMQEIPFDPPLPEPKEQEIAPKRNVSPQDPSSEETFYLEPID